MINEPRTYRHSPVQLGLVVLIFGILGVGLLTSLRWADYLILIPFAAFYEIVFLTMLYSLTTKTTISDNEISTQTLLGTKSLGWNEIDHVSGRGSAIKLNNSGGDVTVPVSPQLPGYEEIVEWIGNKRPDLFNPQNHGEMTRNWALWIFFPLIGLIVVGMGAFLMFQLDTDSGIFPFLIFFMIGIFIIVISFLSPQSLTMDGKSLLIKYLFNEKTVLADEILSVDLKYQRSRNGKRYYILLNLVNGKTLRISGLRPNLAVVYLTLKNWHKKNT